MVICQTLQRTITDNGKWRIPHNNFRSEEPILNTINPTTLGVAIFCMMLPDDSVFLRHRLILNENGEDITADELIATTQITGPGEKHIGTVCFYLKGTLQQIMRTKHSTTPFQLHDKLSRFGTKAFELIKQFQILEALDSSQAKELATILGVQPRQLLKIADAIATQADEIRALMPKKIATVSKASTPQREQWGKWQ